MRVSFDTSRYNTAQFRGVSKKDTPPTKKEVYEAKVKKATSECFWVALGACIIAMSVKVSYNSKVIGVRVAKAKKYFNYNNGAEEYLAALYKASAK